MKELTLKFANNILLLKVFIICLSLSACDSPAPVLNSERIQQRFGSYGVEVLHSDSQLRISNLYSEQAGKRTCRTYAMVEFAQPTDESLAAVHARIEAGHSIGSTLRDAGWVIEKRLKYIGELALSNPRSELIVLMGIELPRSLALHAYDIAVSKSGQTVEYASIVEIHHPDYLSVDDLRDIYGDGDASPGSPPALPDL